MNSPMTARQQSGPSGAGARRRSNPTTPSPRSGPCSRPPTMPSSAMTWTEASPAGTAARSGSSATRARDRRDHVRCAVPRPPPRRGPARPRDRAGREPGAALRDRDAAQGRDAVSVSLSLCPVYTSAAPQGCVAVVARRHRAAARASDAGARSRRAARRSEALARVGSWLWDLRRPTRCSGVRSCTGSTASTRWSSPARSKRTLPRCTRRSRDRAGRDGRGGRDLALLPGRVPRGARERRRAPRLRAARSR